MNAWPIYLNGPGGPKVPCPALEEAPHHQAITPAVASWLPPSRFRPSSALLTPGTVQSPELCRSGRFRIR